MADEKQEKPSLHIDSDWKAEAQAEKERLAQASAASKEGEAQQGEIPPANFQTLLSGLVTQALLYMGAIPDPMTGQRYLHLELARHHVDLLGVLQEKTKGNLEEEDEKILEQTLQELRLNYVQLSKQVAEHMKKQQAGAVQGAAPTKPGGLVMP